MNTVDIILIIVLSAAALAAICSIRRQKKNGKACTGDCAGCSRSCKK